MYTYKATPIKVVDGDTVVFQVDLGFRISQIIKARFYGINAPEIKGKSRPQGLISKDFVTQQLPLGKDVTIKTYKDKQEKYGRYLVDVFIDDSEVSLNQIMVEKGLAETYII